MAYEMKNISLQDAGVILFLTAFALKVLLIGQNDAVSGIVIPGAILASTVFLVALRDEKAYPSPLMMPLAFVFLLLTVAATRGYISDNGMTSLQAYLRILLIGCVYTCSYIATCWGWGKAIEKLFLSLIIIHVILGIVLLPLGFGYETGGVMRPAGITGRPQLLANIASLGAIFSASVMVFFKERRNYNYIIIFVICVSFLIISATLKNALTVLALLGFLGIYFIYKRSAKAALLLLPLGIGAVTLVLFSTGLGDRVQEVLEGGVRIEVARGEELESSLVWRVLHWRLLLIDWYNNYFWFGSGLGQVIHMKALTTDTGEGYAAHSDWIAFFVELGPILFTLFVIGVVLLWRSFHSHNHRELPYSLTEKLMFAMFIVMSAGGNVFYSAGFLYFFWFIAGQIDGYRMNCRAINARLDNASGKKL